MKRLFLLSIFLLPSLAQANVIDWDRNADDTASYKVYACFTKGCVVQETPLSLLGSVIQPAATVLRPSLVIDLTGKEGTIAAAAVDVTGNESALSVPVPFDFKPPNIPAKVGVH